MSKNALPDDLKSKLKTGQVIPFVGAGISKSVVAKEVEEVEGKKHQRPMFPDWSTLLCQAVEELQRIGAPTGRLEQCLAEGDLLGAAQAAKNGLGGRWGDYLSVQLDPDLNDASPASFDLARAIWQINPVNITTNYDRVLEYACPVKTPQRWTFHSYSRFVELLSENEPRYTTWHLHGHIDNAHDVILTPDNYSKFYEGNDYQAARKTFENVLTTKVLLFVGFSLEDEFFCNLMSQRNDIFDSAGQTHYLLVRSDEERVMRKFLREKDVKNVQLLIFPDFGRPMIEFIMQMSELTPWDEGPRKQTVSKALYEQMTEKNNELNARVAELEEDVRRLKLEPAKVQDTEAASVVVGGELVEEDCDLDVPHFSDDGVQLAEPVHVYEMEEFGERSDVVREALRNLRDSTQTAIAFKYCGNDEYKPESYEYDDAKGAERLGELVFYDGRQDEPSFFYPDTDNLAVERAINAFEELQSWAYDVSEEFHEAYQVEFGIRFRLDRGMFWEKHFQVSVT